MSTAHRRLPWQAAAFDSGIPQVPVSDSVIAWIQPLVATFLVVMAALTVTPLDGSGRGRYGLLLLIGCAVLAYARSLPDRFVPTTVRLAIAVVAAVLAGLLFGYDSISWGVAFAYLTCGHVGFRFRRDVAAALVGLVVVVCLIALLVSRAHGVDSWPWWTALTVWTPVVTGLARQNRIETLRFADEVVVQTRRATESERQASVLAERTRVARDIHDVLAHSLSGVSLQLDLADALLEAGRIDEGRAGVQTARELVVDGLVEARRAVQMLRDGALDVSASLRRMTQNGEDLQESGDLGALDAAVAQAVVRTVQESLTNARRHAPGAPTVVAVREDAGQVVVDVVNAAPSAGTPPNTGGSGMGLVGIRERVADLGGTCTVGPETQGRYAGGWRLHAVFPATRPGPS